MIDRRCFEKGHIKKETYVFLDSGILDDETRCSISQHLATCNECSSDYAEFLTADLLLDVPEGFNEKIIGKVTKDPPARINRNKFQVIQYVKLATAAVLAISLYSAGVFNSFFNITSNINIPQSERYLKSDIQYINKFNEKFSEFTKKINNFNGVDFYEKK